MGKTENGAVWLDPEKTSPYEFFQYWRNVADSDVERCLALLTFLPMDEVRRLGALQDSAINDAKEVLAFEVTKNVHGEEAATKAREAARALFAGGSDKTDMPTTEMNAARFEEGIGLLALLTEIGLTASNGEARRLVQQGGVTMNDNKITDFRHTVVAADFVDGELILKKGKKKLNNN